MSKLKELINQHNFRGTVDPKTGEPWQPQRIVEVLGLRVYKDLDELKPIVQKVLDANPKVVEQYKKGNKKVIGLLMKEVFDMTLDGADPSCTQSLIDELILIQNQE
jgi:Asp-tRNA(Asn)/Glu-tRNA(Gln) amidotransferase B subunit